MFTKPTLWTRPPLDIFCYSCCNNVVMLLWCWNWLSVSVNNTDVFFVMFTVVPNVELQPCCIHLSLYLYRHILYILYYIPRIHNLDNTWLLILIRMCTYQSYLYFLLIWPLWLENNQFQVFQILMSLWCDNDVMKWWHSCDDVVMSLFCW